MQKKYASDKQLKPRNKKRIKHSRYFIIALIIYVLCTKTNFFLIEKNILPEFLNDSIALLLVVFGAIGRFYSMLFIGGKKDRQIVVHGPFSIVRNPLYVCSFVSTIGFLLALGRWDVFIVVIGAFLFYYQDTVNREEENLQKEFGKTYLDYKNVTPKFIPNFKLWKQSEFMEVKTSVMTKYFWFLIYFIVALPLIEGIENFKEYFSFGFDIDKLLGL